MVARDTTSPTSLRLPYNGAPHHLANRLVGILYACLASRTTHNPRRDHRLAHRLAAA
ncbi:hypothetical protein [Lentzea sp.]|uniref:hypothetical protein n=1 Tax=Lentzea sp. TaxID=56099 RepID=UPI002D801D1A|nr:hypothetical protein [Lentzea sp.]